MLHVLPFYPRRDLSDPCAKKSFATSEERSRLSRTSNRHAWHIQLVPSVRLTSSVLRKSEPRLFCR